MPDYFPVIIIELKMKVTLFGTAMLLAVGEAMSLGTGSPLQEAAIPETDAPYLLAQVGQN